MVLFTDPGERAERGVHADEAWGKATRMEGREDQGFCSCLSASEAWTFIINRGLPSIMP